VVAYVHNKLAAPNFAKLFNIIIHFEALNSPVMKRHVRFSY